MIRKPRAGEYYGPPEEVYSDSAFQGDYPNLHEYLTLEKWQDGSIRSTSTLTIFVSSGILKIVLNDRDNNRSAFFNGPTMIDCLEKMELQLKSESVDWKSKGSGGQDKMKTPF